MVIVGVAAMMISSEATPELCAFPFTVTLVILALSAAGVTLIMVSDASTFKV